MCLGVTEILLCWIGRETAGSSGHAWILVLGIKTILNVNTCALIIDNGCTCCMINFLNAACGGSEWMRVYLRVIACRIAGWTLNHINSPIWLRKLFHFPNYYYSKYLIKTIFNKFNKILSLIYNQIYHLKSFNFNTFIIWTSWYLLN